MTHLRRRKSAPMGVKEKVQRLFPGHLQFVRGYECIVPDCNTGDRIQACHVRKGTGNNAMSLKPPDWWTYPGCVTHHVEQGSIGEEPFERKYGVDLKATAIDLAKRSRFEAVREMAGVKL